MHANRNMHARTYINTHVHAHTQEVMLLLCCLLPSLVMAHIVVFVIPEAVVLLVQSSCVSNWFTVGILPSDSLV